MYNKQTTATVIGHNECRDVDTDHLRAELIQLINSGVTTFISGGTGGFDRLCARMIHELKKSFPHIRSYIVIPYLDQKIFEPSCFDGSEFPECLETVPYRYRISHRNRWMADNAAYAVCYVTHSYGGAAQTYRYAKNHNLCIIDIKKRQQP
ncbi:MAG: DUF1273 family protein [Oscillospiraceae bacterium]|nr:DUF1273 family protein [Oscillospiraceae bacterium]MBQ8196352.1 DUF1273 family protein [Oscillospiraceae bacterium]